MRKIDADALEAKIVTLCDGYDYVPIEDIDNAPTIEEHKGKWIKVNPFLVDTFECSECGWQVCTEELLTPYCPWCGAKMEE